VQALQNPDPAKRIGRGMRLAMTWWQGAQCPETRHGNGFSMAISEVSRVTAASVALVPVVATPRRLTQAAQGPMRPDATFVAHLIAMAEMSPQTRSLRRAAPEDVEAAYRSVANQNRIMPAPGVRMRQTA
jgi:hypothetical protein